jgi:diguanylate cyclase (GGDEF)-like protein
LIEPERTNPNLRRPGEGESAGCQRVRLLIVDDEEMMRTFLREVLKEEGYEIALAPSGDEAVRMLERDTFDIVLTDIVMPGMDGLGVVAAARKLPTGVDVIVMTGYASMETAVESMKLGAADYITKPFNIDQIRIIVANVVKERRLRRQAAEGEFYKELSRKDGLTELYNHRFFHQLLAGEVSRGERYGRNVNLIMIDIDHFKQYNDAHGHPAGDMALRKLAHVLKRCVRACDYVARYGGEEFAIIVPEIDLGSARSLAERVRTLIDETEFEGEDVMPLGRLTASLGVAAYPTHASTKEELVEQADRALYAAKAASRNCVVVAKDEHLN